MGYLKLIKACGHAVIGLFGCSQPEISKWEFSIQNIKLQSRVNKTKIIIIIKQCCSSFFPHAGFGNKKMCFAEP